MVRSSCWYAEAHSRTSAGLCGEVAFFERERIEIKDTVFFPIENVDVRGIMLPAEKIHLHDDPIKSGDYRHDIASFRF